MMLALLIYCYSHGIFGSRRIEAATHQHLSVRYLAANTHPDHDTICKFRRENFEAIGGCFLRVCAEGSQLIVGARVSQSAADHGELEPTLAAIPAALGAPARVLVELRLSQ